VTLFGKAPRPPQRIALYDNNRHMDCWLLCWLGAAGIALDAAPNFHALPNPELAMDSLRHSADTEADEPKELKGSTGAAAPAVT
jgi:hypothetical protein